MTEREMLTQERVQQIVDGSKVDPNGYEFAQLARLALQAPQFQPANEVWFKIDLGVPFYLVEMKPSEPERYTIHSCFGSSAEDALARQVSTLQSKLAQPAPPSDAVEKKVWNEAIEAAELAAFGVSSGASEIALADILEPVCDAIRALKQ